MPVSLPLPESAEELLAQPGVGTLTTLRPDGSPHVVTVRFTWDRASGLARVMTIDSTRKARNLAANPGSRASLCQPDGFRWITLEGPATVSAHPGRVAAGVRHYTRRYGVTPPDPPGRVVVEIAVDHVMGIY